MIEVKNLPATGAAKHRGCASCPEKAVKIIGFVNFDGPRTRDEISVGVCDECQRQLMVALQEDLGLFYD